ncbi:MAG: transporter substrate-binding domain-containing protein [Christensenellaceae bacterium]
MDRLRRRAGEKVLPTPAIRKISKKLNGRRNRYALKAGTIDVIWNGMTITDELKENILLSDVYLEKQAIRRRKSKRGGKLHLRRRPCREKGSLRIGFRRRRLGERYRVHKKRDRHPKRRRYGSSFQ